jgi:hypothetical protein
MRRLLLLALFALMLGGSAILLPASALAAPGTVIVDDTSPGFSRGGPGGPCSTPGANDKTWNWCWQNGGYNGHYWYTWNSTDGSRAGDGDYGVWSPNLPCRARYHVYAYIPEQHAYTHGARYQINNGTTTTTVTINQQLITGWDSNPKADLGSYIFEPGAASSVRLGDATGETWASTQIGFDAMKWVPESDCMTSTPASPPPKPKAPPASTGSRLSFSTAIRSLYGLLGATDYAAMWKDILTSAPDIISCILDTAATAVDSAAYSTIITPPDMGWHCGGAFGPLVNLLSGEFKK